MSSSGSAPVVKLIVVSVDSDGNPQVDQDMVEVWSTSGEQVKWESSGVAFRISFDAGSPFASSSMSGPSAQSGALKAGASGDYKYSVHVGNKVLDPKIGVRP